MPIRHALPPALLCVVLTACQSAIQEPGLARLPAASAVQEVRHGMARSNALYAIGRYHQGLQRHADAITAFRRLLDEQPQHADARNRLGLSLAATGEMALAIAAFRRARDDAPSDAGIRNNLGYALLLHERIDEAIAELEAALALAPDNERLRQNLAVASTGRSARTSLAHLALDPPASPPATEATIATTPATPMAGPVSGLRTVVPASPGASSDPPVRLEISNGNGMTGLARRTASELGVLGYERPRLTNTPVYDVAATHIEYRPGFEKQALQLRHLLRNGPSPGVAKGLRSDIQVRLVLGHDARRLETVLARHSQTGTANNGE